MKHTKNTFGLALAFLCAMSSLVFAAEKLPQELENVGITEHLGDQVDLNLSFRNEKGQMVPLRSVVDGKRPVLLFLAYYRCPNLCNLFLNGATESLKKLEWSVGKQFQILTVSINSEEQPELAQKKKESYLEMYKNRSDSKSTLESQLGWHFWVNNETSPVVLDPKEDQTNVRKLANQVGFGYKYDKEQDQYAHSAAMVVLTPEGKISRYLYGIEFEPRDLKLALVEAGGRKIGSVVDHILLFCYNYDPKTRKYSLYATNLMRAGGGVTTVLLGGILLGFWSRNRRRQGLSGRRSR